MTDSEGTQLAVLGEDACLTAGRRDISGKHRARVIEWKEDIAALLAQGYSLKTVWRTLVSKGAFSMGYSSFRRHCAAVGLEAVLRTGRPRSERRRKAGKGNGMEKWRADLLASRRNQRGGVRADAGGLDDGFVHPNEVDLSKYYKS